MANKIKYGLKNVHYSVTTEIGGAISYGTPVAIPGSVNMVQNAVGDPVILYADDVEYYREDVNNGYDGTLEMALIPDQFRIDVFGEELDVNGALIENANTTVKKIALMYEFTGDAKKIRHVNYNVTVSRPNIDGSTKAETKDPKTETINIAVRPAIDTGDVKAKLEQGKTGYDTFFSAVYLKDAPTNDVVDDAAYTKSSGLDLVITYTTTATTHAINDVLLDGLSIGGLNVTVDISAKTVTISDTYLDTKTAGTHTITLVFSVGNAVDVPVTISNPA